MLSNKHKIKNKRKLSFYMNSKKTYSIIITGGGTGGHYYPALAIADALEIKKNELLKDIELKCHYIGSRFGIEERKAHEYVYPYTLVPIKGFSRYRSAESLVQNLLLPSRIIRTWIKTRKIFRTLNPVACIATGGYVSLIPGMIANKKAIPLFLQEQNAYPGITTKKLSKNATELFYAYDDVKKFIKHDIPMIKSGNPIRSNIVRIDQEQARITMGLDPKKFTLFIFGGSQGSLAINRHIAEQAAIWIQKFDIQILWQTGTYSYTMLKNQYGAHKSVKLVTFIDNMSAAYSSADLVIARAGALSLAEIESIRIPSILIPLPTAAGNHQYYNAKVLEKLGCSIIVEEKDFSNLPLIKHLNNLVNNPAKLKNMSESFPEMQKDSAEVIADRIINTLIKKNNWSTYAR